MAIRKQQDGQKGPLAPERALGGASVAALALVLVLVALAFSPAVSLAGEAADTGAGVQAESVTGSARAVPDASLSTVYLGGQNASDDNDGTSVDKGVATFVRAKELLAQDGTIVLASAYRVDDEQTLSLEGKGYARVVRAEGLTGEMIELGSGGRLTLEHIEIDGFTATSDVDSIIKETDEGASLTLGDGAVLRNNKVSSGTMGSAIQAYGLALTMEDGAKVTGNSTTYFGYGAIFLANGSRFTMNGGSISGNTSNRGGGVALVGDAQMTMNGGVIEGNKTYGVLNGGVDSYGGAVYLSNYETMTVVNPTVQQLRAGDARFTMTGGAISGNASDTYGGAILTFPDTRTSVGSVHVDIQGGEISGNSSTSGGAIAAFRLGSIKTYVSVSGGTIEGNEASSMGGALFLYGMTEDDGSALATVSGGTISGNKAAAGGAAFLYMSPNASVLRQTGGNVSDNVASAKGGAVYVGKGSTFQMSGGAITGNNAGVDQTATQGDGIYVGGRLQVSADAHVAHDNDVYLPSGHYVEVVDSFDGQSWEDPMSITSEDHVVEPVNVSVAGTKLVEYTDAAGGTDAALQADEDAIYVPSAKMLAIDPTFTIGKSEAASQTNFMTYVTMRKAPWKYEVYYETLAGSTTVSTDVTASVDATAPDDAATVTDADGRTFVLGATSEQRQRYLGTEVSISHDQFDGQKMGLGTLGVEYVFDSANKNNLLTGEVRPAEDKLVLRIYYRLAEHTVTYTYEGTVPEDAPTLPSQAAEKYAASVDVALAPTLDGWTFSGWAVKEPTGLVVSDGSFVMPNTDVQLVGTWSRMGVPVTPEKPITPTEPGSPVTPSGPGASQDGGAGDSAQSPEADGADESLPQTGDPFMIVALPAGLGAAMLAMGACLRHRFGR